MKKLNEKDFHNVERLAKRFDLEELAKRDDLVGKDFCKLMDKIVADTKKRKRLINTIKIAGSIGIVGDAILHIKAALDVETAEDLLITMGSITGTEYMLVSGCKSLIDILTEDIEDNAVYAASFAEVLSESMDKKCEKK